MTQEEETGGTSKSREASAKSTASRTSIDKQQLAGMKEELRTLKEERSILLQSQQSLQEKFDMQQKQLNEVLASITSGKPPIIRPTEVQQKPENEDPSPHGGRYEQFKTPHKDADSDLEKGPTDPTENPHAPSREAGENAETQANPSAGPASNVEGTQPPPTSDSVNMNAVLLQMINSMEKQRQQDRKDHQQMMDNFMKMQIEQQNLTRAQMENVTMTNKQLMEASNRSQDISSKEMINMSKDLREVIEKSQKYNETQKGKRKELVGELVGSADKFPARLKEDSTSSKKSKLISLWRFLDKLCRAMSNKGNMLINVSDNLASILSRYFEDVRPNTKRTLGEVAFMVAIVCGEDAYVAKTKSASYIYPSDDELSTCASADPDNERAFGDIHAIAKEDIERAGFKSPDESPGLSVDRKGPVTLGYCFYQMFQLVSPSSRKADEWKDDIETHRFQDVGSQRDIIAELNLICRLEAFVFRLGGRINYRLATLQLLDELRKSREFFTFPSLFDKFVLECEQGYQATQLKADDRAQFRDLIMKAHALISTSDEKLRKDSRRREPSRAVAEGDEDRGGSWREVKTRGRNTERSKSTGPERRDDRSESRARQAFGEKLCFAFHDEREHVGCENGESCRFKHDLTKLPEGFCKLHGCKVYGDSAKGDRKSDECNKCYKLRKGDEPRPERRGPRKWNIERPPPSDTESNGSQGSRRSSRSRSDTYKGRGKGGRDDDVKSDTSRGSRASTDSAGSGTGRRNVSRVMFEGETAPPRSAAEFFNLSDSADDSRTELIEDSAAACDEAGVNADSDFKRFMKMPFDPDSADEKSKKLVELYLLKAKNPANGRSVSDARKDLEKHVLECLECEHTDFETVYALSDALKVFTRKTKPNFQDLPE